MWILLIDDKKMPEDLGYECQKIARDYASGIAALQERHWDVLLLDHDLADFSGPNGDERKGIHVIRWLARPENRVHIPGSIVCVSYNPIGAPDIVTDAEKLYSDPDGLVMKDREYMEQYYASLGGPSEGSSE